MLKPHANLRVYMYVIAPVYDAAHSFRRLGAAKVVHKPNLLITAPYGMHTVP